MILFTATLLTIIFALSYGKYTEEKCAKISVLRVIPQTAETIVSCTGIVEEDKTDEIVMYDNTVIDIVTVEVGDKVKKGDIVAYIDYEKTALINGYTTFSPDNAFITAPMDGYISDIFIEDGVFFKAGEVMVRLSNRELKVKVSIDETNIKNIKLNQTAVISGVAFEDKYYIGNIIKISENAKRASASGGANAVIDVELSIEDKDDYIKPGYTAEVKILTERKENALIIPYESIDQDKDNNEFVYVLKNNCAEKTVIKTGDEYESGCEITHGLNADDIVITDPSKILYDGQLVRVCIDDDR